MGATGRSFIAEKADLAIKARARRQHDVWAAKKNAKVNPNTSPTADAEKSTETVQEKASSVGSFVLVGAAAFPGIIVVSLLLGYGLLTSLLLGLALASPVTLVTLLLASLLRPNCR